MIEDSGSDCPECDATGSVYPYSHGGFAQCTECGAYIGRAEVPA